MIRILTDFATPPEALAVADVYTDLGAVSAADQARAQRILRQATAVAEKIALRHLWHRSYEARIDGDGLDRLFFPVCPIDEIESVTFGPDGDELVEDEDFVLFRDKGYLLGLDRVFCQGSPFWISTFTAGYWIPTNTGTAPATARKIEIHGLDIQAAIWEMVRFSYRAWKNDPTIKSERIGGAASIALEYETGLYLPERSCATLQRLRPAGLG